MIRKLSFLGILIGLVGTASVASADGRSYRRGPAYEGRGHHAHAPRYQARQRAGYHVSPARNHGVRYARPRFAPPALRVEVVRPRPGYVWVGGNYAWRNNAYVWAPGSWRRAQAGQQWIPGRWELQAHGYVWIPGFWQSAGYVQTHASAAPGHVWVEGHYQWQHGAQVWVPGHWQLTAAW
jgi:hypothetical protein